MKLLLLLAILAMPGCKWLCEREYGQGNRVCEGRR